MGRVELENECDPLASTSAIKNRNLIQTKNPRSRLSANPLLPLPHPNITLSVNADAGIILS